MTASRPLRRNDIVMYETARAWSVPARVVRRIDPTTVQIISTMGRLVAVEDATLTLTTAEAVIAYDNSSCPARRARPLLRRMPSLRRLKQAAAWYDPTVWRKPRQAA